MPPRRGAWPADSAGRMEHPAVSSLIPDALRRVTGALPNGGESRPGQVTMAEAVERAISERRHVIV